MKIFRIFLLVVIFPFLFCHTIRAADWRFFSQSARGDCFYDAAGVEKISKNVVRVLTRVNINPEEHERWRNKFGEKYNEFDYEEELKDIQCVSKKTRLVSVTEYDRNGGIIEAVKFDESSDWDHIAPGSINHSLLKIVCKEQRSRKRTQRNEPLRTK